MNWKKITKIVILVGLGLYIIYDIFALILGGATATLSYQIWLCCKKFMFLPLALGTAISHWTCPFLKFIKRMGNWRYLIWISLGIFVLIMSIITYPVAPIHPFIMLILGIGNGLFWSIEKRD